MKKHLVLLFVGICSVTLVAGPHGHHGGHHHHYHHGGDGLWTARQIVGIVADGVRIANGVGYYNYPYYQTPVVYQPAPVYTQPQTVVYQQPVQYVQPQTVVVQPQPQTVVVQQPVQTTTTQQVIYVQPRREFIVTRILRAVLE